MSAAYFRPGVRALTIASLLTFVVAVLHTLGLANDQAPDPQWASALDAMRGATVEAGPFAFSLYDVLAAVWIQVGVLLVMLSGKNLLLIALVPPQAQPRVIRALSLFDAACCGVLTILSAVYAIPPPLVSFALLTLAFLAAAAFARGPAKTTPD